LKKIKFSILLFCLLTLLSGCNVGLDYNPPAVEIPKQFKEGNKDWQIATPQDDINRGDWWKVFEEDVLNTLMEKLNLANQSIAVSEAQYRQAKALVDQARSSYFPTIANTNSSTWQKVSQTTNSKKSPLTVDTTSLNASWEPDLWGGIRNAVTASEASAQASAAQLALTKLSMQASLAQYYFQLRTLDLLQKVLDENVKSYKKLLEITQSRFNDGVASMLDIVTVKSQLEASEVAAMDNGVLRGQYEHAIAMLIGKPASDFTLKPNNREMKLPTIPTQIPSTLLERRPDIAQAERQMAYNNAEVGQAKAAYFPSLTLGASVGYSSTAIGTLFTAPAQIWSLGPQIAATLFDGGLLAAKEDAAVASYDASVATYRQTILAAFQDVEDNLIAIRLLEWEAKKQKEAVANAKLQLKLVRDEYISGTAALSDVVTAQINAYSTQNTLNTIKGRQLVSSVALVKALGGGWKRDDDSLNPEITRKKEN
jgi:NodT family efflux transporter outer membrane factor (OMF) lipoprotein